MVRVSTDRRVTRIAGICLALPGTAQRASGDHLSFHVGKRVFAYALNNHHGDGIVGLCCKVALGGNTDLVTTYPKRYYLPAYIGPRGWVGLRLDRATIDWDEATGLVHDSYRLVAPRHLAKRVVSPATP
jgi:predicted DNA-binding protein (MmcQ/YjbR family)